MSSPTDEPIRLILCEGREDLAFWTGLLLDGERGCVREKAPPAVRETGAEAGAGHKHFFRDPAGRYVEVYSVGGRSNLLRVLRSEIQRAAVRQPIARLLFSFDPDTEGPAIPGEPTAGWTAAGLTSHAERAGEIPRVADGRLILTRSGGEVELAPWRYDGEDRHGVPRQQTLERLTCAALTEVYPERGEAVHRWLADRPDPPDAHGHKSAALSFMAGWKPDAGNFNFYGLLWSDPPVRDVLVRLLQDAGTAAAVDRFLAG